MNKLTTRFINSLNLNPNDYDLEMIGYKKVNNCWIYDIAVSRPWNFSLLDSFIFAVSKLNYQCKIKYSYLFNVTSEHAISLFNSWYYKRTLLPFDESCLKTNTQKITLIPTSKEEEEIFKGLTIDFNLLLDKISYPFTFEVETFLEPFEEEEDFSLAEEEEELIYEDEEEEIPFPDDSDKQEYGYEGQLASENVTNLIDDEMQKNLEIMIKERENERKKREYPYTEIRDINLNLVSVDFDGKVFSKEVRVTRSNALIHTFGVQKNGRAISAKVFIYKNDFSRFPELPKINVGDNVRIKGQVQFDKFTNGISIKIDAISLLPPTPLRKETYTEPKKRIELHTHTKMSVMDGVGTVKGYFDLAQNMGHKAIAITDHGCVQAFPEVYALSKKYDLKVIYGAELYMIDTEPNFILNPNPIVLNSATYTVFDLETTGLSERYDKIIEFGAIKVSRGMIIDRINILINPGEGVSLSDKTIELTGITPAMLYNEPLIETVIDRILAFIGDTILVSHNAQFDVGFLNQALIDMGRKPLNNPVIDTLPLSRYLFPESGSHNLGALARNFEVIYDRSQAHRADYDAQVLNEVWQAMLVKLTLDNQNLRHLDLSSLKIDNVIYKHLMPYHVIALAKNQQGIKDLYELISLSHIDYLAEVPKIPRTILEKYRENLLISPACFNGEIFQTAMTRSEKKLVDVMSFYDYIEIQPPANYSHLLHMNKIESEEKLYIFLKDIAKAARIAGKPLVVTGDVHYENPEDKIFRDVLISAKAVGKVPHALYPFERDNMAPFENPDQHYRSTQEMLDAFVKPEIFSLEEAKEYVIENTHLIANQIESVRPLKNKLYTPEIENVDVLLHDLVFENAHKLYGENLPFIVKQRLDRELEGIISNGYAVIYYLSYKIVKKANDDGYVVGSRGSVGSSFVATMAGITEVNPLKPHYRCPNCKYTDFEPEGDYKSGFDLPPKKCPLCDTPLISDGQNIPFETFLGFKADKVPDIDLNFPGDYQARAHEYTRELLGEDKVFRAGTIDTIKERTAYGFALGFYERAKYDLSTLPKAQIDYVASGINEVKRTTGQHPGGIIIVPENFDIHDFTPVQYPANDIDATWKTTHLDYHAIHDNILKFDLLGHVDPLALKMMSELTGVDINDIPLGDKKVLSLFSSVKELKLSKNYLEEETGALGIPEFGTSFVRRLLKDTRPKSFNELIIISGLSHGTDVWANNAEKLIKTGKTNLDGVIGCRDDIMTYLIEKEVEPSIAFNIMESVRKGRGVQNQYLSLLRQKGVPNYYIDSFNMIKYLFPRAHATAYVMMAFRVAYFKLYYPLEYYATFFSVRSKQYDIQAMISGTKAIRKRLEESQKILRDKADQKEEDVKRTLQIALEMLDRGYSFENIDLYKSDALNFIVDKENGKLIPPFITIDGLGENTAVTVIEARKDGPFTSVQDLVERTKLNSQNIDRMRELGVLKGLPETNQLNLFDFF